MALDSSNLYIPVHRRLNKRNGDPNANKTNASNSGSSLQYEIPSMDYGADTHVDRGGDGSSSVSMHHVSPSLSGLPSAPGYSSSDGQRGEALSKIEGFCRGRTTNNGTGTDGLQQWDDLRRDVTSPSSSITHQWNALDPGGDGNQAMNKAFASSSSLSDDSMQVYTLGKLVPRREQTNWNPGVDPSAVAGPSAGFVPTSTSKTPHPHPPQVPGPSLGGSRSDQNARRDEDEEDESEEEEECVMPTPTTAPNNPPPSTSDKPSSGTLVSSSSSGPPSSAAAQKIRVRRTAFVPSWAVPPRVLIVDDDIISRKLGGKFLQVSGCQFDMAVDGESAVNKMMNLEKYDLVLMVRILLSCGEFQLSSCVFCS